MIPIVTVTYTPDKWCMMLQAHSIEKFVSEPTTHYVFIEDDRTSMLEWECLLKPIYKRHKLVLLNKESAPDMYLKAPYKVGKQLMFSGWTRQQYVKLHVSKMIREEYYLILDSKNIFFKSINLKDTFYGKEGSGSVLNLDVPDDQLHESLPYWLNWMKLIEFKYRIPRPKKTWFTGTPFVFKTDIAKHIVNTYDIEELFTEAWGDGGDNRVHISEFMLYSYFTNSERINWRCSGGYLGGGLEWLKGDSTVYSVFTMFRLELDNGNNRDIIKQFFLDAGLDEKYVVPAVYLTSAKNR